MAGRADQDGALATKSSDPLHVVVSGEGAVAAEVRDAKLLERHGLGRGISRQMRSCRGNERVVVPWVGGRKKGTRWRAEQGDVKEGGIGRAEADRDVCG